MALRDALTQTVLIGLIFFALPGMFNSINAMAGGIGDSSSYSTSTAVLYACFSVFSFLAPVCFNILGARMTLFLGTLGYVVFCVALWVFDEVGGTFLIAAGALTGISAGLLWTAQGALIMAYPTAETKGYFVGVFWVIFNLGGVMGGAISFATNYDSAASDASSATYIAYVAIMAVGSVSVFLLVVRPEQVVRPDGSLVVIEPSQDILKETVASLRMLWDPRMLCLLPYFVYSNFFYTFQFSVYNAGLFNARTQGFNNIFYWWVNQHARVRPFER